MGSSPSNASRADSDGGERASGVRGPVDFAPLERALGYAFRAHATLEEALTHASYANETGLCHNERLEYLGDAVLELCVSETFFSDHPDFDEGDLTKARSRIVRETSLALWAKALNIAAFLRLGKGLEGQGGRGSPSVLADAVEAVLGAVFLDGGYEAARGVVRRWMRTAVTAEVEEKKDAKTMLQEFLQAAGGRPPAYRLRGRTGPDHAAVFEVEAVLADGSVLSVGRGNSIKAAEFAAAGEALARLRASGDRGL